MNTDKIGLIMLFLKELQKIRGNQCESVAKLLKPF